MNIGDRLDRVLLAQLGRGIGWTDETSLTDDQPHGLALDSLDMVELVMGIEKEFRLEVPDDIACERFLTVRDIKSWLELELTAKPALSGT